MLPSGSSNPSWKNPYSGAAKETQAELNRRRVQNLKRESELLKNIALTANSKDITSLGKSKSESPEQDAKKNANSTLEPKSQNSDPAVKVRPVINAPQRSDGKGSSQKKKSGGVRSASSSLGIGFGSSALNEARKTKLGMPAPLSLQNIALESHGNLDLPSSVLKIDDASGPHSVISPSKRSISAAGRISCGQTNASISHATEYTDPISYKTFFSLKGSYSCVEVVKPSACIWAANQSTGCIEVFSSVTGELIQTLPAHTDQPLVNSKSNANSITIEQVDGVSGAFFRPTVLKSTPTHVLVGYAEGTVSVYDHLVISPVTEGRFHSAPIQAFCCFPNGGFVSASKDGYLVHWDDEANNFEAVTAISCGTHADGNLTCLALTSFPDRKSSVVLCGFESGSIYGLDVVTGYQGKIFSNHTGRINAIATMRDLVYTASKDGYIHVWGNVTSGFLFHQDYKLLKTIPTTPCVTSLILDESTESLWVAYADGLVERWSANPYDDFSVEEVVREAMTSGEEDAAISSLQLIGSVETLHVLALASNGINRVWHTHHNTIEENEKKCIEALNEVISQDTVEASMWKERIDLLYKKEKERKGKYVAILERLCGIRVLALYFERWRRRSVHVLSLRQRDGIAFDLEKSNNRRIIRCYFEKWCLLNDQKNRSTRCALLSQTLASTIHRMLMAKFYQKWNLHLKSKKLKQYQLRVASHLEFVSQVLQIGKFYYQWLHHARTRLSVENTADSSPLLSKENYLSAERKAMRDSKARRQLIRIAESRSTANVTSAEGSNRNENLHSEIVEKRAEYRLSDLYAKQNQATMMHTFYIKWKKWGLRRAKMASLFSLASLREKQHLYHQMYHFFLTWRHSIHAKRILQSEKEVSQREKELKESEQAHADIFDKLQLQKHIEDLLSRKEQEESELRKQKEKMVALELECEALRKKARDRYSARKALYNRGESTEKGASEGTRVTCSSEEYSSILQQQLPLFSLVHHTSSTESINHVMNQLKGATLNLYTDMPLFRQIKERIRSGTTALSMFLESFSEIKRTVVFSSRDSHKATMSPIRWPLSSDAIESVPLHQCSGCIAAVKTMIVSFDLMTREEYDSTHNTRVEIVRNADWIFLLFRLCSIRRKTISWSK